MLNVACESMPMEWSCAAHLQQICDAPESPTANETAKTGAVDAAQAAVPRRRGRQQESQLTGIQERLRKPGRRASRKEHSSADTPSHAFLNECSANRVHEHCLHFGNESTRQYDELDMILGLTPRPRSRHELDPSLSPEGRESPDDRWILDAPIAADALKRIVATAAAVQAGGRPPAS